MSDKTSSFPGRSQSPKFPGSVRDKVAITIPFVPLLPLCPTCFLGYGAAVLEKKYDLDLINLNAELYFRNRRKLKQTLDTIESNCAVLDHVIVQTFFGESDANIDGSYEATAWDKYSQVYITIPSWCPLVRTEEVLRLSRAIKKVSPSTRIFFFGNSLGSWTSEAELKKNQVQPVHLNSLCEMGQPTKPVDYDALPIPIYGDRDKYLFDILPFMLKHGCPWGRCKFCSLSKGGYSGYVERSPKAVIKELEALVGQYNPAALVCTDHSLNGDNLIEVCSYLEGLKKPWGGWSRADLSGKKIEALSKAGCRWIYFGLESGSDRTLSAIIKGLTARQISDFIRTVHSNGILPAPSFLIGTPGEESADFDKSIQFLEDHKTYFDAVNVFPFTATPASEFGSQQKHADKNTPLRLFQFVQTCKDLGLKVFVGEQFMQYYLFNRFQPQPRAGS